MVCCSPVAMSTSSSRRLGRGLASLASVTRLSVVRPIADTVTATLLPCATVRATRVATLRIAFPNLRHSCRRTSAR